MNFSNFFRENDDLNYFYVKLKVYRQKNVCDVLCYDTFNKEVISSCIVFEIHVYFKSVCICQVAL